MSAEAGRKDKVIGIVGGGLVGSLTAVYAAERGFKVWLFERRPDIRLAENVSQLNKRSINLALSHRGLSALKATGLALDERVLEKVIPMKGRMIHGKDGRLQSQAYGTPDQHINSVDRGMLNELLVNEAENHPNVTIKFDLTLISTDLDNGKLVFKNKAGESEEFIVDLVIGADGAYSKVRNEIMKKTSMNFSQEYIDHYYCELTIPPTLTEDGSSQFQIDPNHLHIWPRHTYMMIALPNLDKSFTCTLFAPKTKFDSIKNEVQLMKFFKEELSDAVPLIGWERLKRDYFSNPKGSLLSVKCKPYNYGGKAVIIGDAAHCMVPFYGQGMNCGFEDVELLFNIFDKHQLHNPSLTAHLTSSAFEAIVESCLDKYSIERAPDAAAMCDLALHNYVEMRSSVTQFGYLLRKKLETWAHKLVPAKVIPLYTMISFTSIRYSEAWKRWHKQSNYISHAIHITLVGLGLTALILGRKLLVRPTPPQITSAQTTSLAAVAYQLVSPATNMASKAIEPMANMATQLTEPITDIAAQGLAKMSELLPFKLF